MTARATGGRPRVGFVVQRYHPQVGGGAERHCGLVAAHMAAHWDVEVLTTCAADYRTWADHYPPGLDDSGPVPVRRFRVPRPRDYRAFDRLSPAVLDRPHTDQDEQRWLEAQGPVGPDLLAHLDAHAADYDLFVFFTYLYWTTVRGLPRVADKAWLVPTAHDEKPIYLRAYDELFRLPRAILYNTTAEMEFCRRRFGRRSAVEAVVGCGADPPPAPDAASWEAMMIAKGVTPPYILYVGRVDPAKGCDTLVSSYLRLLHEDGDWPPLVLLGPVSMPLPAHPRIVSFGYVSEAVKAAALAEASLLIQPSPFESLSLVLLEAWLAERAVLVNGRCEVLRRQVVEAGGGLYYETFAELRECLIRLLSRPAECRQFGRAGRTFVEQHYTWPLIEQQYLVLARRFGL